ncbi:hypothetical protein Tco_1430076 [Tanacetum coccineum]
MQEEQEMTEQQKKRQAEVLESAKYYTEEDWDIIRANVESNAELSKILLGENEPGEDFATRMVNLLNQRKKFFAEQRAQARRNRPMTQTPQRTCMSTYLKHQGSWTFAQLKKLSDEEIKAKYERLVRSIANFVPMGAEVKEVPVTEEQAKEPTTPSRRDLSTNQEVQGDRIQCIRKWTMRYLIKGLQSLHRTLHIMDRNHYMMKLRDDLSALYQLVIDKYQDEILEGFDLILWGDLTIMFHLNEEDDFWESQEK